MSARALLCLSLAACAARHDEAPPPPVDRVEEPAPAPPPGPPAADLAGWDVATSMAGMFTAAWRPTGGAVPENELFELDVLLFEGAGTAVPLSGAEVVVSAWMPDHMHGMNRRPEVREVAPGRYHVRGMLLHMEGLWQLFIDVIAGGVSERAQFELTLR
jgi:hypothetical protein